MREIKFRVWNGENIEYITSFERLEFYFDDSESYLDFDSDVYKIMQYTGLKDKNRKEIYEGDIFKFRNNLTGKVTIPGIYELLWTGEASSIEVIGNIYESPELLEDLD